MLAFPSHRMWTSGWLCFASSALKNFVCRRSPKLIWLRGGGEALWEAEEKGDRVNTVQIKHESRNGIPGILFLKFIFTWGRGGKISAWQPGALPQPDHPNYPGVLGGEGAAPGKMRKFSRGFPNTEKVPEALAGK